MGVPDIVVPIHMLMVKELNVKGSFRYGVRSILLSLHNCAQSNLQVLSQPGDYKLAIQLAAQGKIDLKPLVTHR